jgi:hypothetical protein
VKLIAGLLSNNIKLFTAATSLLQNLFGKIDYESDLVDFNCTDYYAHEMGADIKRKFLSFKKLVDIDDIHTVKLKTNSLEGCFSESGKRQINIDPGYLNMSKLVLFSTKDYSHRIYSGSGIYSEITLFYKNKKFNPWPWTYTDYKSSVYAGIFEKIRCLYKDGLNEGI